MALVLIKTHWKKQYVGLLLFIVLVFDPLAVVLVIAGITLVEGN